MAWRDGSEVRKHGEDGARRYVPPRRLKQTTSVTTRPSARPASAKDRAGPQGATFSQDDHGTSPLHERLTQWRGEVFDVIEWRRFEAVVETLFAQAGFGTRAQSHGADGGVDIWLYSQHHAEGREPVSIVQCKHWMSRSVGVKPVRELRGVMAQHGIARGQFVTTSHFTADAQRFAGENGIALHDTSGLLQLIAQRQPAQREALLAVAYEGDYWRPTCASCGVKLVERKSRATGQMFWGCINFPKGCKSKMQMTRRD